MPASKKIRSLFIKEVENSPIDLIKSVYDYFIFLKNKRSKGNKINPSLVMEEPENYSSLSEKKFSEIWDNDEDSIYDQFV